MTAIAPGTLRQKFEEAVNKNDFAQFREDYRKYLSQFPSFNKAYSAAPTEMSVHSAIFGHTLFYLKQTNDAQAQALMDEGRAASKAFGKLTVGERLEFLKVLEEKVKKYGEDIGIVITADTGKPIELSEKEMSKGAEWFDYAYKNAEAQIGPKGDFNQMVITRPMGVAQIIGAYNYPYALAVGGIVGALAVGNGVIVSAPMKAPNWVFPFMQAVREAAEEFAGRAVSEGKPWAEEFAANAIGLVQCSVGVNRNLTAGVDIVHFVGGDVTGNIISKSRGIKRTILEMGGSNVVAVMNSALDHDGAAKEIAAAIYAGFAPATGQRCTAPRMLCAEKGAEDVVMLLGKMCAEDDHHIGNPFSKGTKMGPLVDRGARQKMEEAIVLAEEVGAKVYGTLKANSNAIPMALNDNSFWVQPVMIDWSTADLTDEKKAARVKTVLGEEIFGPLIHVLPRIEGIDAAVAVTNKYDTHGLAGAIFSANDDEVAKYAAGVRVTSLTVGDAPKDRSPNGPHGHPGVSPIGGSGHFKLYADEGVIARPKAKPPTPKPTA